MSLTTTIRASVLLTALSCSIPVAHAQNPTTIDYPGAINSYAAGINDSGQIAGYYFGSNNYFYGFSLSSGAFSSISVPGSLNTYAFGISDSGQIVGSYDATSSGNFIITGFIDDGGALTGIAVPGNPRTEPAAISSDGTYIVGGYRNIVCCPSNQGFVYTGGAFTTIDYPGAIATVATGVNRNGTIVGWYVDSGGNMHGFVDDGGAFTSLDFPGAASSAAAGINDSGTIVGSYGGPTIYDSQFDFYFFTGNNGFVYSGGLFNSLNMPTGSTFGRLAGINNNGAIVGYYLDAASHAHGVLYTSGAQSYINPKYLIVGVTYAPPGGSASSVSYQNTSVVGNSSTITKSFTNAFSVTVGVAENFGGGVPAGQLGKITETVTTSWSQKTTTSKAVTLTKTSSTTFKTPGVPNVYSPVDHDYDIIWLWLNPLAIFTLPNTNTGGPIIWNGYGYDLNDPLQDVDMWPIYVGYLNGDFGPLSAQDANALSRSWVTTQTFGPGQGPGITSADYPNILKADPFAYNPSDANSGYILALAPGTIPATSTDGRFTASSPENTTPQSIPYAQAPLNSTQGIQETYQSIYSTQTQTTQTSDYTYMVGYGLEVSTGGLLGPVTVDLKTMGSFTWENISQTQNTKTSTQTDTAVITSPPCPATTPPCNPEYTEPHEFAVFQDNLYGTFMFWPNPYFAITGVTPAKSTVAIGSAANYTISTQANAGYSGTSISFNVAGLPTGATINQGTVEPGNPFTLTVTTTSATPAGSFPLTISATDGALSYFAYATLFVLPQTTTSFVSSLSPSNFGQAVTFTATVTGSKSPTGTVTFSDGSAALGTGTLNSSGVATYTTSSLAVGQHSMTAVYDGDTNNAGSTSAVLTQTVNTADFALSSTPSGATVRAGNSAPFTVTVTPQGSFSNSISFSCSGLPALASCTFSPSTVTPNANTATSNLSVTTVAHTASLVPPAFDRWSSSSYAICLALSVMLLGMLGLVTPNRRKLLNYALVCVLASCCLLQVACGRGGSTGGTPAGTYAITVTGAAGSFQRTTTVTLTVH
jgi:hypothetical protein